MITHDLRVMADAMLDKKAQNVTGIDLRTIGTAITDFFVICNADSTTNVNAASPHPRNGEQFLDHPGLR